MKELFKRNAERLLILLSIIVFAATAGMTEEQVMAKTKTTSYTIKYNANGGKGSMKKQKCKRGKKVTLRKNKFKRSGYTFAGWNLKKNGRGKSYKDKAKVKNLTKKKTVTLYAQWKHNEYTVYFNANGGSTGTTSKRVTQSGTYGSLPTPYRRGYTFRGWFTAPNGGSQITRYTKVNLKGNQTLYAQWVVVNYTIHYDLGGGSFPSGSPGTYNITSNFQPATPVKKGYTFVGWYEDDDYWYEFDGIRSGMTGDLYLYAKWNMVDYTIRYELNGGTNHENNPDSYNITDGVFALRDPERERYEFKGWYLDEALTKQIKKVDASGCTALSLYADWEWIPVTRYEYIRDLTAMMGLSLSDEAMPQDGEGTINCTFDDCTDLDAEEIKIIEIAVANGLVKVPEKAEDAEENLAYFYPDRAATRDFAAYAAAHALGCSVWEDIDCADLEKVISKAEAGAAVSQKLMELDAADNFRPDAFLQTEEEQKILEGIEGFLVTDAQPLEEKSVLQFKSGVKTFADTLNYTVEYMDEPDSYRIQVQKTDNTAALRAGDICFFPLNVDHPGGFAAEVAEVSDTGETITLLCVKPEDISEVLSSVEMSGYGTIDSADELRIEVDQELAGEGLVVEYDPNGTIEEENAQNEGIELYKNHNVEGTTSIPGTINWKFDSVSIGKNAKLNGTFKIEVPSIAYRLNFDLGLGKGKTKLNDLYFAITEKINLVGDVTVTAHSGGIADAGAHEIGRISIPLGVGFSADIVFWVNYSAQGKASITYTLEMTQGIQYVNKGLRTINDANVSQSVNLNGTFEAGPKLSVMLTFGEIFDLVDITADGGFGAKAEATARDSGMVCTDIGTYVYLTLSAGKNSLIGELLNLNYDWPIWKNTNSPFRKNWHAEGDGLDFSTWKMVQKCTYGEGTIAGSVISAENRNSIPGAAVKIYKVNADGTTQIKKLYTDSQGKFSTKVPQGTYKVVIGASKHISHTDNDISVIKNETVNLQTVLLSDSVAADSVGTISGEILDSVSGRGVAQASITVRKGFNNTTGNVIVEAQTDADGVYQMTLPCGSYSLELKKDNYISSVLNVTVKEKKTVNANGEMTRTNTGDPEGMLRVVLTWGERPEDLDSHMVGPTVDGDDRFHVYFSDESYYEYGEEIVNLDRDDTDSYGPETVAVYAMNDSGTYSYYVHDYTNEYESDCDEMSYSGAKVNVYYGGQLIKTYSVPYGQEGTLWHVFDFDAATKQITAQNEMSYESDCGSVGLYRMSGRDKSDLQRICEDIRNHKK